MNNITQDSNTWTPLRIVLLYALFGILWITFSDRIVLSLAADPRLLSQLQTWKGGFFILVTAVLLFWLMDRMVSRRGDILRELRQSEEYNRDLFERSPIGLALCAMDGHLLDVNPAYAAIIGRTVDETMHLTYWDITPTKYAEEEQTQLRELQSNGRYGPYEKEYIHRDGHLVPVRLQGRLIEQDGEQCIWSSVEDISERKQAEAALHLSEEKFAKTFRNSPDAIALTSMPDSKFVEVNESFLRLSGYRLDEIIGRTTLDLGFWVHQADRQRYLDLLQRQGRAREMETDFRKKSGEIMRSLISGEIIDLQGHPFILTVILDITERKQAEEVESARHMLEEQIAGIVKTAPGAICAFRLQPDGTTALPFVSPKWEEYYQLTQDEVRNDASLMYQRIHPDDAAHVQQSIQESARTMLPWRDEFRIINPTGGQRWVEGHSTPVLEADGSILWNGFITDISDRKESEKELVQYRTHLEELVASRTSELERSRFALQNLLEDVNETKRELEVANAKLLELDRLKSMFIASMSHELRTPLNSIIGFTGLLLQEMSGAINAEQRDHLERVFRAGKHLLSLITDVIDIAKIESGKILPHAEDFMLGAVVDEACDSIKVQLADKGLTLIKKLPATPIPMHSDRRRLLQCLLNFLSNAVKFSEKGTIVVEAKGTKAEREEEGKISVGEFVEISVSDTGVGIKQEDMGKLFHSFVRLESSLKIIVPGTGLGLYLTKKLATEVLGGDVAAESREGEGSTFRLKVPVCLEEAQGH